MGWKLLQVIDSTVIHKFVFLFSNLLNDTIFQHPLHAPTHPALHARMHARADAHKVEKAKNGQSSSRQYPLPTT